LTADVIQLRDWDWLRPPDEPHGPAEVIILPVVRVQRLISEIVPKPPRRARRSLLDAPT
jgi:hypothetical protein